MVYVLRHKIPEGEGKVRLSGYGVELQIKSTEYKVNTGTAIPVVYILDLFNLIDKTLLFLQYFLRKAPQSTGIQLIRK